MLPDLRVRQRDYLLEISRAITQELDLQKVLARILHVSIEMLAGQAGLIALRKIEDGWRVAVTDGLPAKFSLKLEHLLATVPEHEEPELYELSEINRLLQALTRSTSMGLLSGVALPLIAHSKVIGLLFIFRNYMGSFSANDKALLQSFADQAAIAVHNAQLYTQIRKEEQRLSALMDSLADGILILLPDHSIEHCNPAMTRMLGIPEEKLIGARHEAIIRWIQKKDGATLEQAEAGGWPLTPNATLYVEGDLERNGNPPLPVGITYSPLKTADGVLLNIIASVRDITRFREADELKTTFISVISHELKTPIALIKGYVSTLRREDAAWDKITIQDSLEVIEEEADHLTELIENLLDASRLQAGVLSIHHADVNLEGLARRIAKRFEIQSTNHEFIVEFPGDIPIILGDEDRLGQVFSNLISNAIKYSPTGGKIKIQGQVLPRQVVVCVSDEGPGIAMGDVPYVFDRFYRSNDAARTTKGAGLGLFLSRAVIEAHNGRIWVDPKAGEGARICFSLPRDR